MQVALQSIVLAARAAEVAVFDGVYNQLDDLDGFLEVHAVLGKRDGQDSGWDARRGKTPRRTAGRVTIIPNSDPT